MAVSGTVNLNSQAAANYTFLNDTLALSTQQEINALKTQIKTEDAFKMASESDLETEAQKRLYENTLRDKISNIKNDKLGALNSLMNDLSYILEQDKLNKDAVSAFGLFSEQQNSAAGENIDKLKLLRESIYTLRKDSQNAEEQYKRYNMIVYLLKVAFITLVVITVIVGVNRGGLISSSIRNWLIGASVVFGMWYVMYEMWYNIGRDSVFYDVRNWKRNF